MPYTPPSHRSPASSTSSSPDVSRRPSFQSGPRPSLPRSASYLNKHRRTPSVNGADEVSPQTSPTNGSGETQAASGGMGASVRQSPPPRADERELIPRGAIISPPESTTSGSDEDEPPEIRGRRPKVMRDLREAVSQIQISKTPPPQHTQPKVTIPPSLHVSLSTSALSDMPRSGRKHGHTRSATEPHASILKKPSSPATASASASEDDTDEDLNSKPQMVRKKSGELVRPALRGHRRPSSVPGTPTFSKAVHFDSHLEHVRHFLQVDRPLAVSAGSSPVAETFESDAEYPFPRGSSLPFEWELTTPNFPHDSLVRRSLPVRLERIWLSSDQKSLLGSVAVANLAFSKSVVCRFTMDYWKTVSEVNAEFSHDIRSRETQKGQDRFTFSIKLSDTANLESKTLFFCVRYNVNNQEFWDNNNATNFQVDFKKKHLPQGGKNHFHGAGSTALGGLPRSNRRQPSGNGLRPISLPASMDAFGHGAGSHNFDQPIHEFLGDAESAGGLRFKSKSSSSLASDNIGADLVSPSGVAFSNRYDFSASLDAAVKAAKDASPGQTAAKEKDTLYMRRNVRDSESFLPVPFTERSASGTHSPASTLSSASYEELVNKYCFFGSATKPSSPPSQDGPRRLTMPEGRGKSTQDLDQHKLHVSLAGIADSQHTGAASHHSLPYDHIGTYFPAYDVTANPTYSTSTATPSTLNSSRQDAASLKSSNMGRTTPPTLVSGAGTPASDVISERFPWTADAHGATAIQG